MIMEIENFDDERCFTQPKKNGFCYEMYFGKMEKYYEFEDDITKGKNKLENNCIYHVDGIMLIVIWPETANFQEQYDSLNWI